MAMFLISGTKLSNILVLSWIHRSCFQTFISLQMSVLDVTGYTVNAENEKTPAIVHAIMLRAPYMAFCSQRGLQLL